MLEESSEEDIPIESTAAVLNESLDSELKSIDEEDEEIVNEESLNADTPELSDNEGANTQKHPLSVNSDEIQDSDVPAKKSKFVVEKFASFETAADKSISPLPTGSRLLTAESLVSQSPLHSYR